MDINAIIKSGNANDIVMQLSQKTGTLPAWESLVKEYEPSEHDIVKTPGYNDRDTSDIVKVTKLTYNYQKLAVNRMSELCFGIPVNRETNAATDEEKEIGGYIENIFKRSRIDTVNLERSKMLFAGCEVMTLWYGVPQSEPSYQYGFKSKIKLRCKNFSPMNGDELYPLFDEYGDLVALSVKYCRQVMDEKIFYFDTYTNEAHIKFENREGEWEEVEREDIKIGKIPGIYVSRPTPIWENTTHIVNEIETVMSLTGNYLKKNSKPIFAVFTGDKVDYGNEKSASEEDRAIFQFPVDAKANYITWNQSVENLKFYIAELRQSFFTQLQLPDWSYESMKSAPMSGESRKQLFVDALLKVQEEGGRLTEFLDREVNVIKGFLKTMLPGKEAIIDKLQINSVITPFTVTDEADTIKNMVAANGGLPLISHQESISKAGLSANPQASYEQMAEERRQAAAEMTM